jgi:hypothetical protein
MPGLPICRRIHVLHVQIVQHLCNRRERFFHLFAGGQRKRGCGALQSEVEIPMGDVAIARVTAETRFPYWLLDQNHHGLSCSGIMARGLQVIGYLPLLSKSAGELVMGGDDRHLDFRVAILLRTGAAGGRELVVVTVVHCHNRLGRTYLAVIAPFHRTILLANLERAVRVMEG